MAAVTIALVDDHRSLVDALSAVLAAEGFVVAGCAHTAQGGKRLIGRLQPDLAVVDLRLPDDSGLAVAHYARDRNSPPLIIFYTSSIDPQAARDALDEGAQAVVLKDATPTNLLKALAEVLAGRTYLDVRLARGGSAS